MIFDKLNNIGNYEGLDKIYDALVFLKSKDFSNVPIGKYILNEKIYYIVQEYCTHIESLYSEAHEEYVDIQFLVFGQEKIGIAQLTPDIVASRNAIFNFIGRLFHGFISKWYTYAKYHFG